MRFLLALLLALVVAPFVPAEAQVDVVPAVVVTGVWARPTAAAAPAPDLSHGGMMDMDKMEPTGAISAAYMTIANEGEVPLRLVAVTSAAGTVEIHETQMDGDMMQMRPVEGGLEIPAGESVDLAPGGYHLMLLDLTRDLIAGEAIALTLMFESETGAGEVRVGAPITDLPPLVSPLLVRDAWARPTAAADAATPEMDMEHTASGAVSAVYFTLENRGDQAERLVSAATTAAGTVEIHQTQMDGDMMRMRPVEGGLEILAGESVDLAPGGYHIMLIDLARDLVPGEAIPLTLTFESGAALMIGVPVYEPLMAMADA